MSSLATTAAGKPDEEWDLYIKKVQSALNITYNKGINSTPVEALIGYRSKNPAEAAILNAIQTELQRLNLDNLRKDIIKHITEDQIIQKERYDKARKKALRYKEGDIVMIAITSEPSTGSSRKLRPKYKGSFCVCRVLSNDRYEVRDLRECRKRTKTVAAADRMRFWHDVLPKDL